MRPLKNPCEIAVIGGGLAGLSAAHRAARLGRQVTLFESSGLFGGLIATIDEVDGLATPGKFSGQDVAMHALEEARMLGVRIIETGIARIELDNRITLADQDQQTYHPEAVIVASGASLRKLGVAGEEEFAGRGVSRCATCDGGFYRGADVVVIGGGDSAVQEALTLAKTSRRVIMACRSPVRAKHDYVQRLAGRENVEFIWDNEVTAILGGEKVSGVSLRNIKDGTSSQIECAGVFPFIGTTPNSDFVPPFLRAAEGHIKTTPDLATSDGRVFAAGAVRQNFGGDIMQAIAEGIGAAEAAARVTIQ